MQIQVLNEINALPDRIHLALDTCVFFDAYKNPKKFQGFFELVKSKRITLTTTALVYFEFSRGFDTIRDFKKAEEGFSSIVDYVYPLRDLDEWAEKVKRVYRKDGKNVDITDMFMCALLLKYKNDMLVMSKNHKHFLTELYDIQAFIPLLGKNEVQTYCFYRYSEAKYVKRLKQLEKTI